MDLTGELEDRNFIVTRGDSRLAVTLARNDKTVKLGRTNRFLIDDPDSPLKLAYTLSKPFKLGGTFMNQGIFKFVLQEVNSTDDDNQELGIADYYKHFPKNNDEQPQATDDGVPNENDTGSEQSGASATDNAGVSGTNGRKVWL